jgi:hypothetical protein
MSLSLSISTLGGAAASGLIGFAPGIERVPILLAQARGPAQVGFEDLPDVHARRHAQRVQHDVDGVPSSGTACPRSAGCG